MCEQLTNGPASAGRHGEPVVLTARVVLQVEMIKLQQDAVTRRNADAPQTQPETQVHLKFDLFTTNLSSSEPLSCFHSLVVVIAIGGEGGVSDYPLAVRYRPVSHAAES